MTFLVTIVLLFSLDSSALADCIANGQFSTEKNSAVQMCADRTALSLKDCQARVKCFGPISFCIAGESSGEVLPSVIAECSHSHSVATCEASLKCFSNVSSCMAGGQNGSNAQEAIDACVFKTKFNRTQCLASLQCQEEKYPMPARPPSTIPSSISHDNKGG